uniref:ferredoxin--NADP(+) reductase n=1 Tax=Hemiselmis tepida TaxID=464990 RepID=A0A7S0YIW7_9CRYP|mmetsp:Transcript_11753/g.30511  ORF Transcript_11753/g.30511 Transcript_11753/m.30511 type:complete len:374 (+) Transcript_11753:25-1146(+)
MVRTAVFLAGLGAASAFVAPGVLPAGGARAPQLRATRMSAIPTVPFDSVTPTGPSGPTLPGDGDLDFLEATPYWDQSGVTVNIAKQKDPLIGKIVSVQRMVGPNAPGETCNIVIDHEGKLPYWEGQSYGVLPPGIDPKKNKPYGVRLYSIASTRYGDDKLGKTTTLCVRRATYWDPETGKDDPAKKGVCSNYLCDAKPGDEVKLTGPSGKVMLMPEDDPNMTYIMVATGTGIAPFRTFLRRLFGEATPAGKNFKGLAWLFLGVANKDALLYDEEFQVYLRSNPDKMRLDYALSREGPLNKAGGKMYIQDKVEEYSDEVFDALDKGAHMYFCGLKGMMPGIQDMLQGVCKEKGINFEEYLEKLKKNGQWHVEVY